MHIFLCVLGARSLSTTTQLQAQGKLLIQLVALYRLHYLKCELPLFNNVFSRTEQEQNYFPR